MIHPTAIVAESARIANDAEVGPFCVIGEEVEIGARTKITSHVVINGPTVIGEDNQIYQFASLGEVPQDKKYAGEATSLEIGNRNTIFEGCTISRGTVQDDGKTQIGDDNWIMAYAHIAHDCRVGNHTIFANNATLGGHVRVGDWAILGGFAGTHQFCRIGAHSFLGAYSYTTRDVPAYTTVTGQPSEPRGINSEGLKRRGFSQEEIRNIKNAYRTVYRQGLKLNEAIAELELRVDDQPEVRLFLESLAIDGRGLIR